MRYNKESPKTLSLWGLFSLSETCKSIVLCTKFEVTLGMVANRTNLRSILAHHDMATVAALPDAIAIA